MGPQRDRVDRPPLTDRHAHPVQPLRLETLDHARLQIPDLRLAKRRERAGQPVDDLLTAIAQSEQPQLARVASADDSPIPHYTILQVTYPWH